MHLLLPNNWITISYLPLQIVCKKINETLAWRMFVWIIVPHWILWCRYDIAWAELQKVGIRSVNVAWCHHTQYIYTVYIFLSSAQFYFVYCLYFTCWCECECTWTIQLGRYIEHQQTGLNVAVCIPSEHIFLSIPLYHKIMEDILLLPVVVLWWADDLSLECNHDEPSVCWLYVIMK